MRSRHLDLLKSLGEKNRDKEEQQRKEEQRLSKRETLLKERILQRSSDARQGADCATGSDSAPAASPSVSLAVSAPVADQEAPQTSDAERRTYQLRCNKDIELRAEESIRRVASHQLTEKVRQERELLKKEWRVHRAKKYLLDNCQKPELKEHLESKGKPRALPKLPITWPLGGGGERLLNIGTLAIRGFNAESIEDEETDLDGFDQGADVRPSPSPLEAEDEASAPSAPPRYDRHCSSPARRFLPATASQQTQASVNRFLERTRHSRAAAHYGDIVEWKRRNGCEPDRQVFICNGGYPDFRDALLARGWFQNMEKDSRHFDLKWGMAGDIEHDRLRPTQIVNHFDRCRDLTTKVGLSLSLKNCIWHAGVESEEFFPRSYDLSEPCERAEFVSNFKFTKAESVLRQFMQHMTQEAENTFSEEVIDVASKMCLRLLTNIDDVLDCPELAENLANVKASEWALLKTVCLEDVSQKLEDQAKDEDVEEMCARIAIADIQKKRAIQDEKEKKLQEKEAELGRASSKGKKKKKRLDDPEEVPLTAPTASFSSCRGQHLFKTAKSIVQELERKSAQHCIHGTRDAWIIKPAGKSRGRGIQVMRELDEIFKATESDGYQWICQKYIEQPQLIHGYKFDIRQWVLVTDWNPLTIYIWQQPYLRFAGQKYDDSLSNLSEYMHLVNNSIIKNMGDFKEKNADLNASGYMWFRQQYEEWLHDTHCKGKHHSTPWKKPPPYTCETFGVKWEDVAFTAKEEDEDEDDPDEDRAHPLDPPGTEPLSSSMENVASATAGTNDMQPGSPTDSEEHAASQSPHGSEEGSSPVPDAPCLQECSCGCHFGPRSKFCQNCGKSLEAAEAELEALAANVAEAGENAKGDDKPGEEHNCECENLWETCIKPQIENIVTWSLLCVVDQITHRKNSFELYGYDFMLSPGSDGKPKVWLIEVNSSPACDYSTPVTTPLVKKMMEDTAKVMVDRKAGPDADTGEWEFLQHSFTTKVGKAVNVNLDKEKLEVCGSQIKPPAKGKKGKKKRKGKGSKGKATHPASDLSCSATADDDADGDEDEDDV